LEILILSSPEAMIGRLLIKAVTLTSSWLSLSISALKILTVPSGLMPPITILFLEIISLLYPQVFASTIFLIQLVKSTELTLSVYLILTPYLTSSAENLISFFDIFSEIALMNNILSNFDSLKYITTKQVEHPIEINSYNLYFYNVSFKEKFKLENINLKINFKDLVCFVGDEDYKIETFFNLINRKAQVSSGCIFFGDKNISDFNTSSFNKYVASVTLSEQFFNISIYENFYLVCPFRQKIFKDLKSMGLSELINSFDSKYNTIVNENFPIKTRFFLGLARAYLSGAKIINIFKLPENLTASDKTLLKNILLLLKKNCTIICYFTELYLKDIFDEIYDLNNKNFMNNLSKKDKQ
jgi:ABC-type multidrug transport system fused ATPase/permease subunit